MSYLWQSIFYVQIFAINLVGISISIVKQILCKEVKEVTQQRIAFLEILQIKSE